MNEFSQKKVVSSPLLWQKIAEEYLNEENIDKYCEALSEELLKANLGEHKVLIVGGAAMALKFRDGRSTIDIDICIKEQNHLYDCCLKVADRFDLPEDWINADVMHSDSFSYALFDNAVLYKKYNDLLEVYVANDIDLYCMKPQTLKTILGHSSLKMTMDLYAHVLPNTKQDLMSQAYFTINY